MLFYLLSIRRNFLEDPNITKKIALAAEDDARAQKLPGSASEAKQSARSCCGPTETIGVSPLLCRLPLYNDQFSYRIFLSSISATYHLQTSAESAF